jgi:hypothetical protein
MIAIRCQPSGFDVFLHADYLALQLRGISRHIAFLGASRPIQLVLLPTR